MTPFPAPLRRFVELFNAHEFWECHEVLEVPWRAHRSEFYHGLILYASAFVHVQRGNPHGVGAQLRKARVVLEPYAPSYLGIDVAGILDHCREGETVIEDEDFPRLDLSPDHLRGDEIELTA